jgi:hypothetical protein
LRGKPGLRGLVMAVFVPIRIMGFLFLAVGCAPCQQGSERQAANSLPESPTVQTVAVTRAQMFHAFLDARDGLFSGNPFSGSLSADSLSVEPEAAENKSGEFLEKYFQHSSLKPAGYHPAASGSLMGRATYAASSILITRDQEGKSRLNTSYIFAVLTSAAAHSAYRPYWRRSVAQPFSDFGATIGNDAGMNVFHEFEPGIRQLVKSHEPKFVSRIEARIKR